MILLRAQGLGGARLVRLLDRFGSPSNLLGSASAELRQAGLDDETITALKNPDESVLHSDLEWLQGDQNQLLTWSDPRYPPLLRDIASPPAALFVSGNADLLWQPQVAVIGTRNPTAGGRENARDFAAELTRNGMTITSGMADGIDSIAHQAALDQNGATVAVLGTGPDVVYPAKSSALAEAISRRGLLISEHPPGTPAKREHFPSRNRIISGLSLGVLVIEAGLKSGTLITARAAGNQGRDVFALPGSIHNPMSKGCHRLIRDGAKLVETAREILVELAPLAADLASRIQREMAGMDSRLGDEDSSSHGDSLENSGSGPDLLQDPDYRALWECLGYDPVHADTLIERSGLTARAVSAMLLMLELRGMVEAHPGGAYSRKK